MNRRHFLKSTTIIGAISMLPTKVFSLGTENESVVWEVEGDTRAAVKKIFEELGGVSTLLPKGAAN
jgi:hypothetical protein